jgi:UrcA family protein
MKTIFVSALAAAALVAPAAHAGSPAHENFVVFVAYDDLNLASAAGARTLENRIDAVADRMCGTPKAPGLAETRRLDGCRASVTKSARPQISQALAMNGSGAIALAASR